MATCGGPRPFLPAQRRNRSTYTGSCSKPDSPPPRPASAPALGSSPSTSHWPHGGGGLATSATSHRARRPRPRPRPSSLAPRGSWRMAHGARTRIRTPHAQNPAPRAPRAPRTRTQYPDDAPTHKHKHVARGTTRPSARRAGCLRPGRSPPPPPGRCN
jgi:hypothetical protein